MRWGRDDSHDICVLLGDGGTVSVMARLDLRVNFHAVASGLIEIAARHDWLLCDSNGRIYDPTPESIRRMVAESAARRFLTDPVKFLECLGAGDRAPGREPAN